MKSPWIHPFSLSAHLLCGKRHQFGVQQRGTSKIQRTHFNSSHSNSWNFEMKDSVSDLPDLQYSEVNQCDRIIEILHHIVPNIWFHNWRYLSRSFQPPWVHCGGNIKITVLPKNACKENYNNMIHCHILSLTRKLKTE